MLKFIILLLIFFISISVYATSSSISLSRIQQSRLNAVIKQIKLTPGEYKLIVTSTGTKLDILLPTEPLVITKEVEVIKEVPVEKFVDKIVEKPTNMCVDLSKATIDHISYNKLSPALQEELDSLVAKNQWFWCWCEYMPKGRVRGCG